MQQFKALFNKEFGSYFRSYLAYIVFFVYLFVSIGCAFYFGSYLAMHDTALYALFYLQPIILTVFVPAITMKMWSEEFKSGTAEFLLTQPINYFLLVGVKSLSAFLFCQKPPALHIILSSNFPQYKNLILRFRKDHYHENTAFPRRRHRRYHPYERP